MTYFLSDNFCKNFSIFIFKAFDDVISRQIKLTSL